MSDPFHPIGGGVGASPKKEDEWAPIVPVPADAPPPPTRHPKLGEPTETYPYVAANGATNGYVWQFDYPTSKEFRPLTYCRHPGGVFRDWRWLTWRKPRPLFNLNTLAKRPAAPVLITEGEKACRAAEQLARGYVCITSPGGSKAAAQADWTPLAGRQVFVWPDNDNSGRQYAAAVAKHCVAAGAMRVSIVEPPAGVPVAWDAGDAVQSGFTEMQAQRLIATARPAASIKSETNQDSGPRRSRHRRPQRDELLRYVDIVELWHDEADRTFATFPVEGHREHALDPVVEVPSLADPQTSRRQPERAQQDRNGRGPERHRSTRQS